MPKKIQSSALLREETGYVMQLQNFSVNDGEGIRTTIFLCGCPLHCIWCCNPENMAYRDKAHKMTLQEVEAVVSRQALFFRRCDGGITFSGGEATIQQGFLRSMTERFYDKGYKLSIETCGYFNFEQVRDILEKMDLIFFDLKLMDDRLHQSFTGVSNQIIKENLKKVGQLGIPLVVRIPVIVGVNAFEDNIHATCSFLQKYVPEAKLEFLPYHKLGMDKYEKLGMPTPDEQYESIRKEDIAVSGFSFAARMTSPSEELLSAFSDIARAYHIDTISFR